MPGGPPTVRVGTSGYNYPAWKGSFYPPDLPASKMLAYYVERFSTVQINATFYRMPTGTTLTAWRAAAREAFTFVPQAAPRSTRIARLRDMDLPTQYLSGTAGALGR